MHLPNTCQVGDQSMGPDWKYTNIYLLFSKIIKRCILKCNYGVAGPQQQPYHSID